MNHVSDLVVKSDPLLGLSQRQLPSNYQAEQALLGAILANNKSYDLVSDFLEPEHFADPVNGRIYRAVAKRIEAGKLADGVTMISEFQNSGSLDDVGGTGYFAQLLTAMIGIINTGDYGRTIYEAWLRREMIGLGEEMVNSAFQDTQEKSAADLIEHSEQRLFDLGSKGGGSAKGPSTLADAIRRATEEGEAARRGQLVAPGTGLPSLDKAILRLRPGHLIIGAGRPGMGKTSLALTIGGNVVAASGVTENGEVYENPAQGKPVIAFSQEMTDVDLAAVYIAQNAGVPVDSYLNGEYSTKDAERIVAAERRASNLPFVIYDWPGLTLRSIGRECRRQARRLGTPGLVIVDYLQLMADPPRSKDKRLAVGENVKGLKNLAKELGCAFLVLSQLSRKVEDRTDKRPTMSDLRETGEIEDAADVIILLYREEFYHSQTRPKYDPQDSVDAYRQRLADWQRDHDNLKGLAEAIIPKVRRGKAPCHVDLYFNGPRQRYEERGR